MWEYAVVGASVATYSNFKIDQFILHCYTFLVHVTNNGTVF